MADDEQLGRGTGGQGPWEHEEDGRAAKQEGDPDAIDVEGDPRGGLQSDEYRHADPRDVVTDENVAMSGPAGAPQEDLSIDERRALGERMRGAPEHDEPRSGNN